MSRSCQPVTKISDFCNEVNDSTIFEVKLPYYKPRAACQSASQCDCSLRSVTALQWVIIKCMSKCSARQVWGNPTWLRTKAIEIPLYIRAWSHWTQTKINQGLAGLTSACGCLPIIYMHGLRGAKPKVKWSRSMYDHYPVDFVNDHMDNSAKHVHTVTVYQCCFNVGPASATLTQH